MKDWRPQVLNAEAIAQDAHLTRIEEKLDRILAMQEAGGFCPSHPFQHQFQTSNGLCNICGKPVKQHG